MLSRHVGFSSDTSHRLRLITCGLGARTTPLSGIKGPSKPNPVLGDAGAAAQPALLRLALATAVWTRRWQRLRAATHRRVPARARVRSSFGSKRKWIRRYGFRITGFRVLELEPNGDGLLVTEEGMRTGNSASRVRPKTTPPYRRGLELYSVAAHPFQREKKIRCRVFHTNSGH